MVFSSLTFLCIFLPVTFLLYSLLPGIHLKNALLLLASLVFYAYGEPVYVLLLIASAFGNYLFAFLIDRFPRQRRFYLTLSVISNLLILIAFKYSGFLAENVSALTGLSIPVPEIRMPIGISFFTFQAMSYVIDVYRGGCRAQKNFGKVLLYISFFPQLIAGPIVKYHDVEEEINHREQTVDGVSRGIRRFLAGLCKKVLIANTMGLAADALYALPDAQVTGLVVWVSAVSYMLQIYFDFSGYSDMAIGLGRMFGFHFKENFNYPYISTSIQEFWRRWHMSLSGWFKEYLYIPLGGNRKGKVRTILNRLIVFLCTGIWHGASWNFVIWGLYNGAFLILEGAIPAIQKKGGRLKGFFQHLYALFIVCYGFIIFRTETWGQCMLWTRRMFTGFLANRASLSAVVQQLTPVYLVTLAAAIIAATPLKEKLRGIKGYEPLSYLFSVAGLALCILSLASGTYNPFIYFRF